MVFPRCFHGLSTAPGLRGPAPQGPALGGRAAGRGPAAAELRGGRLRQGPGDGRLGPPEMIIPNMIYG